MRLFVLGLLFFLERTQRRRKVGQKNKVQSPCLPGFQLQSLPCLRAAVLWVSLLPGAARAPVGSSQEDSSALPPRKEPRLP